MPVFICKEHWENAKFLMKSILGWITTLDPLGYSYDQKCCIPFMVLSKLGQMIQSSKKGASNFLKFQFSLVEETCIQILKDDIIMIAEEGNKDSITIKDRFLETWNGYLKEPVRTPDIIGDHGVFLM